MLAGRHFASEGYRSGFSGESVRGRSWCGVACRGGDAAGVGGADRALGAGHRRAGRHLPGPWAYAPGAVFADLAAAVADGADCIDGVGQACGDREHVFGPAASTTTMWRLVDTRVDAKHLPGIRAARAHARARRGRRGRHRRPGNGCISMSMPPSPSTIPTTRRDRPRPGRRPSVITRCWCSWTAPRSPAVKRWPGCCDPATLGPIPPPITSPCSGGHWSRCRRATVQTPRIPARRRFWCAAIPRVPPTPSPRRAGPPGWGSPSATPWTPGYATQPKSSTRAAAGIRRSNPAADLRDGAWVAEATDLVDMSGWPAGTRLILRKERPHPGAQLRFTDSDGLRVTAFITDTGHGVVPGQLGGLELRHRQHARVEDRIRQAKATGLRNLPCHRAEANAAWLEIILAATDLVTWSKLIGFTDHAGLATCEIDTFRYRVLHVAARITRSARQTRLRIDATWRWATAISQAWQRLRAAFP